MWLLFPAFVTPANVDLLLEAQLHRYGHSHRKWAGGVRMEPDSEALAAAGASALVACMTTSSWHGVRDQLAELLRRSFPVHAERMIVELVEAQADLTTVAAVPDEALLSDVEALLRHRLRRLLRDKPDFADGLRAFLSEHGHPTGETSAHPPGGVSTPGARHVLLAMGLHGYGAYNQTDQIYLQDILAAGVDRVLEAAGVQPNAAQKQNWGDGTLVVLDGSVDLPRVLLAVLRDLPEFLGDWSRASRLQPKVRVAVHEGVLAKNMNGWVGAAVNDAARLLDQSVMRGMMNASSRPVIVSVSRTVFENVVRHGHAGIAADSFREVEVATKAGVMVAWVDDPEGLLETVADSAIPRDATIRGFLPDDSGDAGMGDLLDVSDVPEVSAATRAMGTAFDRVFQTLGPPPEDLLDLYSTVASDDGGSRR